MLTKDEISPATEAFKALGVSSVLAGLMAREMLRDTPTELEDVKKFASKKEAILGFKKWGLCETPLIWQKIFNGVN